MARVRNKTTKLSIADQQRLAKLASRPDVPLAMDLRVRLLRYLGDRFDWFCEQLVRLVEHGGRDEEIQARVILGILARILPEQREVVHAPDSGPVANVGVAIKVVGIERGTVKARQQALEIQAQKRATPIQAPQRESA